MLVLLHHPGPPYWSVSLVADSSGHRRILAGMVEQQQPRGVIYARQSRNKAKSITDQLDECRADAADCGVTVVQELSDGRSASRYARQQREAWALLLAGVERGRFDVVILWEASRGDRTLTSWSQFLDLCRDRGVKIRVTNDERTYDLDHDSDWRQLASSGVDSAHESAKTSKRIRRGVASSAAAGRPAAGPCPYGYRRLYDPRTGALLGQEPDPDTAPTVVEIIRRVGSGDPVSAITRDLNARGVTPPGGGSTWYRQRVRELALSPVYLAKREHRPGRGTRAEGPTKVYDAGWPGLVTESQHWAAVRTLADPARMRTARPGRQIHLLTYLATCSVCGEGLSARGTAYVCRAGHVFAQRGPVDEWVTEVILAYLERPEVYQALRQVSEGADAEVMRARDEVAGLRLQLDQWRAAAVQGSVTPESFTAIEAGILKKVQDAEKRAERAGIPPALRSVLEPGENVRARWAVAPLPAKRSVIQAVANVALVPSGHRTTVPVPERVRITWK